MVAFTSASLALLAALPSALASRYVIKPAAFDNLCLVPAAAGSGQGLVVANCTGELIFWNVNNETISSANVNATTNATVCIDQKDGKHRNGSPVQVWECAEGNTNQAFAITSRSVNDTSFGIQWAEERVCLDLTDGHGAENATVQSWHCAKDNINQKWNFFDVTEADSTAAVDDEDDSAAVFNAYLNSLFSEAVDNSTIAGNVTATEAAEPVETPAETEAARRRHMGRRVVFGSH